MNIPLRWKDRQTESIVMHPNEIIESFFLHHWQPRTINVKRLKQNVEVNIIKSQASTTLYLETYMLVLFCQNGTVQFEDEML